MTTQWPVMALREVALLNPSEPSLPSDAQFIPMDAVNPEDPTVHYSEPRGERSGARARAGDILFARITPCLQNGKVAIVPPELPRCGGSTEFIVIRPNDEILVRYIYHWITSHSVRGAATALMQGATGRQRLNAVDLGDLEIIVPPLAEQQRIVAKLDEVDAGLRALSERLDAEMLRSAQVRLSVMNEVFLQRPGCETQEGSLMSSNWQWLTLGEVVSIEIGRTPSRSDQTMWDPARQSGAVWVSIADLTACEGRVISDSKEYISSLAAIAGKPVRAGTLMMSFKLSIGKLAFAGTDLYTNEAIAALTVKHPERLSSDFLFHYLSHVDWVSLSAGNEKVKGATLNKAKLAVVPVRVPPLAEQQRIVCKLEELQSVCAEVSENIQRRKAKAGELRQSVLAAAFRGDL